MVLLFIGLAILAAWVNWESGLQIVAIVNAVAAFWSNGVLANFSGEPYSGPNWGAGLSMLTTFGSIILLLIAWVR